MKKLIIHGDPGVRRDGVINYDGEEYVLFAIDKQGEWHGPDRVQLWCTVGSEDEREAFEKREFVPHWLDTEGVDAEAVEVVRKSGTSA